MNLVFFLEELSARVMLEGLLPRVLPAGTDFYCFHFEGKQDLEKQLERKLRGWMKSDSAFIVLRDQDSANCEEVKKELQDKAISAGRPETVIRIACKELESWYFGDLKAVGEALSLNNLSKHRRSAKYRIPDKIVNPSRELETITKGAYQKVSGSRAIGKVLNSENNSSRSFQVFIEGIEKVLFE